MELKLAENKELFVKTRKDLEKHKADLLVEDERRKKLTEEIDSLNSDDPELRAFRNMEFDLITPSEEYAIIDKAIADWK